MMNTKLKTLLKIEAILLAICFGCSLCCSQDVIAETDATYLDQYPGIYKIDFSADPVRETFPEGSMVDPEYGIKFSKTVPDEYFGADVSQVTDSLTGEVIDGIRIGYNGTPGECGCIYRKMFQYRGNWVDVRTTYTNWNCQTRKMAFFSGGFAQYKWRATSRMETKNEFFIAGTDTPIEVKGFLVYYDVDNDQGLYFAPDEIEDIWTNSGGTYLGYKTIPANELYVQNPICSYQLSEEVLSVYSTTDEDIDMEGEASYTPGEAAKTDFALTFSASVLHTSLIDNNLQGLNMLNVSAKKIIPSSFPKENPSEVAKTVSDNDESDVTENTVRSWEGWTYRINAVVPIETEPGNFYDTFSIRDQIDPTLSIKSIKVFRGAGEDVTDKFNITQEGNLVRVSAESVHDVDFYGFEYHLEIEVGTVKTREEMLEENGLDENFTASFENTATVACTDGNGEKNSTTNSTNTNVKYETEADITITKVIKAADIYTEHGAASFIFKLDGQTVTGWKRTFNGQVTITEGYAEDNMDSNGNVKKTVTFHNVPEGEYTCSEYGTLRFKLYEIRDVSGGNASGKAVRFRIDDISPCRATFMNQKKDWNNYSDSSMVINRIGIGAN